MKYEVGDCIVFYGYYNRNECIGIIAGPSVYSHVDKPRYDLKGVAFTISEDEIIRKATELEKVVFFD